jgi:phosphodiesterase/alkaline phosphatase D-like protein
MESTCFAFASCQYPAGVFDRLPAGAAFNRIEAACAAPGLQALLLLGDQIYADATIGLLDPLDKLDRYARPYDYWQNALNERPGARALQSRNRLHMTPDDHEIVDNWEPGPDPALATTLEEALLAFDKGRAGVLPARQPGSGYWGAVDVGGGHAVFMLDARTTREPRPWGPGTPGSANAHIVDDAQRRALERWLLQRKAADDLTAVWPKFLSSSVWPLPRATGRASDTDLGSGAAELSDGWEGYPASLRWLLGFVAAHGVHGVVILCGDAHLGGHTTVRIHTSLQAVPVLVHILHAPALYAPFPFANGQPHHYRRVDRFSWSCQSHQFDCEVLSDLRALGDGFVRVDVNAAAGGFVVEACIDAWPSPWAVGPLGAR